MLPHEVTQAAVTFCSPPQTIGSESMVALAHQGCNPGVIPSAAGVPGGSPCPAGGAVSQRRMGEFFRVGHKWGLSEFHAGAADGRVPSRIRALAPLVSLYTLCSEVVNKDGGVGSNVSPVTCVTGWVSAQPMGAKAGTYGRLFPYLQGGVRLSCPSARCPESTQLPAAVGTQLF